MAKGFFQANIATISLTFFEAVKVLSRHKVWVCKLKRTSQYTDNKDNKFLEFNGTFMDVVEKRGFEVSRFCIKMF